MRRKSKVKAGLYSAISRASGMEKMYDRENMKSLLVRTSGFRGRNGELLLVQERMGL